MQCWGLIGAHSRNASEDTRAGEARLYWYYGQNPAFVIFFVRVNVLCHRLGSLSAKAVAGTTRLKVAVTFVSATHLSHMERFGEVGVEDGS